MKVHEATEQAYRNGYQKGYEDGKRDAVKHGRWKFVDIDGWWFNECSICGDFTPNHDGSPPDWNYCPNCGADMRGENDGV